MKKMNKKGFTIVELSIVIAVIAILSAVLIPTFTGIVKKAQLSAAQQEASNAMTALLVEKDNELDEDKTYYFISGNYWFKNDGNNLVEVNKDTITDKEADDGDVIYTSTGALNANAGITIAQTGTPAQNVISVTTLEDIGSVVIWAD